METNVIDNVTVPIIRSRNGGNGMPRRSYGCRPNGRNVLVAIANSRPAFLKHVHNLLHGQCRWRCVSVRTHVGELVIALLIIIGNSERFSHNLKCHQQHPIKVSKDDCTGNDLDWSQNIMLALYISAYPAYPAN